MSLVKLIVFERHGHPDLLRPESFTTVVDFTVLEVPMRGEERDVSSTNVRRLLASGTEPPSDDVLASVLEYIHLHHLFETDI